MGNHVEGFAIGRLTQPLRFELNSAGPQEGQYNPVARYPDGTPVKSGFVTKSGRGRPKGTGIGVGHSADTKAEIVRRYRAGEGLHPLAAAFSTSIDRIREIVKQAGVEIRRSGYCRKENEQQEGDEMANRYTDEQIKEMHRRTDDGESPEEIAAAMGVSVSGVRYRLRKRSAGNKSKKAAAAPPAPEPAEQMDDPELETDIRVASASESANTTFVSDEPEPAPEPQPLPSDVTRLARQRARELHQKAQMVIAAQELPPPAPHVLSRKHYQPPRVTAFGELFKVNTVNAMPIAQAVGKLVKELNGIPGVTASFDFSYRMTVGA